MKLCECGCGNEITSRRNKSGYGKGHNPNSTILNPAWESRILKNGPTEELIVKIKQTKSMNPQIHTEEENLRRGKTIRDNHLKFGFTEKEKTKGQKISRSKIGHIVTEETKEKLRKAARIFRGWKNQRRSVSCPRSLTLKMRLIL